MKNPFRNLAQLERELGDIAVQLSRVHFVQISTPKVWHPALNAFRCGRQFIACVDLAGMNKASIEVRAEPHRLVIRGARALPEPPCDEPALQVLALEIDHGRFERMLELPAEIDPRRMATEYRQGFLWIRLPLRADR